MIGGVGRIAGLAGRALRGPAGKIMDLAYGTPAGRAVSGVVQDTGFGMALGAGPMESLAGGLTGSLGGYAGAKIGQRLGGQTGEIIGELAGGIGGAVGGQQLMAAYMPVEPALDRDKTAPSPDMAQPGQIPLTKRDYELERHKYNLMKARYQLEQLALPQDPSAPDTRGRLS